MTKPSWLDQEKVELFKKKSIDFFKKCKEQLTSLRVQLVILILVGAFLSTCTYILCRSIIILFVEQQYTSEVEHNEREQDYLLDLSDLIAEGNLTPHDLSPVSQWVEREAYIFLLIYRNDELLYRSSDYVPCASGLTVEYPTAIDLLHSTRAKPRHPITVGDETLDVALTDYSEYFYYDMANLFSVVAAIIVLAFILILYFQRVTRRISRLARDVRRVSRGDMNHQIRSDEIEDEISRLCTNVENMRASIVLTLEKERAAVNANADLITSMSHDIRTPLTVLLGYLDVMKMQTKDENTLQYLRSAEQTALRLKKLSDDMFQYFLVFSEDESEQTLQSYDARTLLEQMLSEHVILLKESGFTVEYDIPEDFLSRTPSLLTDAPQCMRIIDNVFSNITKYTDKAEPIRLSFSENATEVSVAFQNAIRADADLAESTGIGLRTCARIAKLLDCIFYTEEEDGHFIARLSLPKSEDTP